eukprot:TRINITY_DN88822_c0_g1_i1.p1 TRINITY_DN88822_c0_g1~~TRINITY_DN88822_c0_g1_i1.p1  ORF type:complete len:415 (+),score=103.79 TRINITY_DN88822_c0_g1_i1:41-1285(+)
MASGQLSGTVKSWNGGKGFGFISSQQVQGDVFFGRNELPPDCKEVRGSFLEGRQVVFEAIAGQDGRFKATTVSLPFIEGQQLVGQIKSFSPRNGYGFITSHSLQEDVRFQSGDIPPVAAGAQLKDELVIFDVVTSPYGKLQVRNLMFQSMGIAQRVKGGGGPMGGFMGGKGPAMQPPPVAWQRQGPAASGGKGHYGEPSPELKAAAQQAERAGLMTGTVKSFSDKNGYGFVTVPGYPADVKVDARSLVGLNTLEPGQAISFVPTPSQKGGYTASNVQLLLPGGAYGGGAYMGKGGAGFDKGGGKKRPMSSPSPYIAQMGQKGGSMNMWPAAKKAKADEMPTGQYSAGTIKSWNGQKGFGFIESAGLGEDVFFMRTSLPAEYREMQGPDLQGTQVNFEIVKTSEGKVRAQNITVC